MNIQLHITTAEAIKQGLPGSDVYKYSHLIYKNDLNRNFGVYRLNLESIRAFADTIMISQRNVLKSEREIQKAWFDQGGFTSKVSFPFGSANKAYMDYINYENWKIATGFELHLKARLLARNYVLQEIDTKNSTYKSLANHQKIRPILKDEIISINPYYFNGKQNYLPGLTDKSLKFSIFTEQGAYRTASGLPDLELSIIDDYRNLRNQIHFPGDCIESPSLQVLGTSISEFLIQFINKEIIEWSNQINIQNDFKSRHIDFIY